MAPIYVPALLWEPRPAGHPGTVSRVGTGHPSLKGWLAHPVPARTRSPLADRAMSASSFGGAKFPARLFLLGARRAFSITPNKKARLLARLLALALLKGGLITTFE